MSYVVCEGWKLVRSKQIDLPGHALSALSADSILLPITISGRSLFSWESSANCPVEQWNSGRAPRPLNVVARELEPVTLQRCSKLFNC